MLRSRIIPCLLLQGGGLVKTTEFASPKYVGDPINAVKIFNEKEADELIVLDIDATAKKEKPNCDLIKKLAAECRMPLCYGGGIKTIQQAIDIVGLGVEKIALSSAAIENPSFVGELAKHIGSQSVVVVLDVRKQRMRGKYELYTHNGKRKVSHDPVEFAREIATMGAGELVINSIDRDGTMEGFDRDIIRKIREATTLPITALGGARDIEDMMDLIREHTIIGAAAGSTFVFKGPYRAVLINYNNPLK